MLSAAEARAARGLLEPHAPVGLHLAAVSGARRGELAALRWEELDGDRLTIDSSIAIIRDGRDRRPELRDDPTKIANHRVVRLDAATCAQLEGLRAAFAAYGPWILSVGERPLGPERLSGWWRRARDDAGDDQRWRLHDYAVLGSHGVHRRRP